MAGLVRLGIKRFVTKINSRKVRDRELENSVIVLWLKMETSNFHEDCILKVFSLWVGGVFFRS